MELDNLYREVVMTHYQNPFAKAPLTRVDASSHGYNPSCGDDYTVNIEMENGKVAGIQVDGHGCAISGAAGSMLGQVAVGMTVEEVKGLVEKFREMLRTGEGDTELPGDLPALAGVHKFPVRIKCASLPMTTALEALSKVG